MSWPTTIAPLPAGTAVTWAKAAPKRAERCSSHWSGTTPRTSYALTICERSAVTAGPSCRWGCFRTAQATRRGRRGRRAGGSGRVAGSGRALQCRDDVGQGDGGGRRGGRVGGARGGVAGGVRRSDPRRVPRRDERGAGRRAAGGAVRRGAGGRALRPGRGRRGRAGQPAGPAAVRATPRETGRERARASCTPSTCGPVCWAGASAVPCPRRSTRRRRRGAGARWCCGWSRPTPAPAASTRRPGTGRTGARRARSTRGWRCGRCGTGGRMGPFPGGPGQPSGVRRTGSRAASTPGPPCSAPPRSGT